MKKNMEETKEKKEIINCLRNERIIIRHIPRPSTMVQNPKHVLYGGMAEQSKRTFVVPKLSSGNYVNVLTDNEKNCLEELLGLEPNALSIYRKTNNFWDDSVNPLVRVVLKKQDNYLDLSSPQDYIRYKVLLANKDMVAPSMKALEDYPKATYQFVCISEGEEVQTAKSNMSNTMLCYKEYGKVEDNRDILTIIIETMEGRVVSPTSKMEFLQTKINELIQANPKTFLKIITDEYLPAKVLIRKSLASGAVSRKGDFYYLRADGKPLCEEGEDPVFSAAAKYISQPKHQSIKFALEAALK